MQTDAELVSVWQRLQQHEGFAVRTETAATLDAVRTLLLDEQPHLLHFAGHGENGRLLLDDGDGGTRALSAEILLPLLRPLKGLHCVLFNACDTQALGEAVRPYAAWAVAMRGEISDDGARAFTRAFYDALVRGVECPDAFEIARTALIRDDPRRHEGEVPVLLEGKKPSGAEAPPRHPGLGGSAASADSQLNVPVENPDQQAQQQNQQQTVNLYLNGVSLAAEPPRLGAEAEPRHQERESPPAKVSLSSILALNTGEVFVRRTRELAQLETARGHAASNVLLVHAPGGTGKTALLKHWLGALQKQGWGAYEKVFAWSFYSQGTSDDRQASSELFLDAALKFFHDPDPSQGTAQDKAERLAVLVQQSKTLLVLDGLEPLQQAAPPQGKIRDAGLAVLVDTLATHNPGLLVASSRLEIPELKTWPGGAAATGFF